MDDKKKITNMYTYIFVYVYAICLYIYTFFLICKPQVMHRCFCLHYHLSRPVGCPSLELSQPSSEFHCFCKCRCRCIFVHIYIYIHYMHPKHLLACVFFCWVVLDYLLAPPSSLETVKIRLQICKDDQLDSIAQPVIVKISTFQRYWL